MTISYLAQPWFTPYTPKGMELTYASTTTITVGDGKCPDSTEQNIIVLDSDKTLNLAKTGLGGLDKGTLAANTKYNIFAAASSESPDYVSGLVNNPENPYPPGVIFSVDSEPSLPFKYDMYRYIGAFYTDGSSHVVKFLQTGEGSERTMWYDAAVSELSGGTSSTYANIDVATSVPRPGLVALLKVTVTPTGAGDAVNILPYGSSATNGYATVAGSVASVAQIVSPVACPTGSNSGAATLQYKVTGTASIAVQGYIDQL